MTNDVDPRYEENFVKVGSFLDMTIFRNRRIGTYNRESVLLHAEVPPPDTKDADYRTLRGSLAPGVSTCAGCSAPVVFNLVAKAAQMRPLFLRKALVEAGLFTSRELDRPGVMGVLLDEAGATAEEAAAAGITPETLTRVEAVRSRLIEEGHYFKLMFAGATGCLTVTTASYPNHVWRFPYFHSAFENLGAMLSGLEAGARARMRDGLVKIPHKVIGFAGDGGSFDIGLQSLSGLWERNPDTLSITYDNQAYMNTGKQRCSSTPWGADTTTAPVGREIQGKQTNPKDIVSIALAHGIPYVATASPDDAEDLMIKVRKALMIPGAAYIRILAPCPPGWTFGSRNSIKMAEEAVDTAAFFSFECETDFVNRKRYFTINNIPDVFFDSPEGRREIADYAGGQGRFRHVFREKNEAVLTEMQGRLDAAWSNFAEFFGLGRERVTAEIESA